MNVLCWVEEDQRDASALYRQARLKRRKRADLSRAQVLRVHTLLLIALFITDTEGEAATEILI